jgi:hypothetical protein
MKTILGMAVALSALASSAAAEPFDSFARFCLDTGGDPAVVIETALGGGWIPDPRREGLSGDMDLSLLMDPATADDELPEAVMVGLVPVESGASYQACSVMGPSERDQLISKMNAWAGFEGILTVPTEPIWIFTRGPTGPVEHADLASRPEADLADAANSLGTIYIVGVKAADAGPFLFLMRVPSDAR